MISYLEWAFAWLLFLSIPALAAGMFYRAWKEHISKPLLSEENAASSALSKHRHSSFAFVNVTCGLALCAIFTAILLYGLAFTTWSSLTALTIWIYYVGITILKRSTPGQGSAT